jgi:transposase InsO family protein
MGHANSQKLSIMQKSGVVHGFPWQALLSSNFCESCMYGKQSRLRFPKVALRAKILLELVYSDLCGPMHGYSLGGARYFITFIDDYSRYSIVYLLQRKCATISHFKEYKALVENQTSHRLQIICTDNGTEFTSHAFKNLCKDNGILHQFRAIYTPQQNGVAERKNRTLVEAAQYMLQAAALPFFFG